MDRTNFPSQLQYSEFLESSYLKQSHEHLQFSDASSHTAPDSKPERDGPKRVWHLSSVPQPPLGLKGKRLGECFFIVAYGVVMESEASLERDRATGHRPTPQRFKCQSSFSIALNLIIQECDSWAQKLKVNRENTPFLGNDIHRLQPLFLRRSVHSLEQLDTSCKKKNNNN